MIGAHARSLILLVSLAGCDARFDLSSPLDQRCASFCDDCFFTVRREECEPECEARYGDLADLCARCLVDRSRVDAEGFCTFEFAPITDPECASLCAASPPDAGR